MNRRAFRFAGLLAVACALAGGCGRDQGRNLVEVRKLVTENRHEGLSLPGQHVPAAIDTVTLWLGPAMARRDAPDGTFLIDAARGELTFVDHRTRTWTTQTTLQVQQQLAALAADTAAASLLGDEVDRLRSLLKVAVRVTDAGESAEIDGYRCRRWIVEQRLGPQHLTTELWLTRDIDADYGLLHQATRPALRALPGGEAALRELSRLDGVPVRATGLLELMNREGRIESRLVGTETMRVPSDFFRPPADYRPAEAAGAAGDPRK